MEPVDFRGAVPDPSLPYREVDYRSNPSHGQTELPEGCPGYDTPLPNPATPTMPQLNMQDSTPSLHTPSIQGVSTDAAAALAFERGTTGAPPPYTEEPAYL